MKGLELSTLILLGLGIGVAMASQAGINAQFRQYVHSPYQAAFFSFVVGALVLGVLVMVQQTIRPSFQELLNIPAWLWLGGFLGAFAVSTSVIIAPRLGAASFTIVVVCGQLIMSLILDHFGWLGFDKHPVNWQRIVGATLVISGLLLTQKY